MEDSEIGTIAEEAHATLSWILSGMGIPAEIDIVPREDHVFLDVVCGDDSSIAIGRKGQTLEALQVLVNRITSNRYPDLAKITSRILIDIDGYRERRRNNLIDMALRMAEEVVDTATAAHLDPMNSYERYLVHDALKNEIGVVTSSIGSGAMKQVLISPAEEDPE